MLKNYARAGILIALLGVTWVSGCATVPGPRDPRDPFESFNRTMFKFNDALDRNIVKPVAQGYVAVVPKFARAGITNFFANLRDTVNFSNNLLQGKINQAMGDGTRILFNSTIGVLGFVDVASQMGLPKHDEDFGQTLGWWGIKSGPYLVLPFFGPSSARDAVGLGGDYFFTVYNYVPDHTWELFGVYLVGVVDTRANLLQATNVLEEAALDRYIFVRDAYLQRRLNQVWDGHPPKELLEEPEPEGGPEQKGPEQPPTEKKEEEKK